VVGTPVHGILRDILEICRILRDMSIHSSGIQEVFHQSGMMVTVGYFACCIDLFISFRPSPSKSRVLHHKDSNGNTASAVVRVQ
jgi:hypothetical protein